MGSNAFMALVENISLLLVMVFVFDISYSHPLNLNAKYRPYTVGLGLGLITVAAMSAPRVFAPGIVFDTRSVLIGISGLFFGVVPTLIVMTAAAGYGIWQGGAAAFTGVCVIVASGLIGPTWRRVYATDITERITSALAATHAALLEAQTITHPDDQAIVHQHMLELVSSQVLSYAIVRRCRRVRNGSRG